MKMHCLDRDIIIERGGLRRLGEHIKRACSPSKALIVTDGNVAELYLDAVSSSIRASLDGCDVVPYVFEAGERSKNAETYLSLIDALSRLQFSRSDLIVALGGGVVGDIAGFAAATYMRGIKLIQAPTTLLAMIDSSIGGKTGIDLPSGKNLLGAFYRPELVVADPDALSTLTADQWKNGLGEGLKYACLMGGEALDIFEDGLNDIERFIYLCAKFKADIVNEDEKERGLRRLLNFGHTVGHAIEAQSGYTLAHGECVAMGITDMAYAALNAGELSPDDLLRLLRLVKRYDLPIARFDKSLMQYIAHDKKRDGDEIYVAKFFGFGDVKLQKMGLSQLEEYLDAPLSYVVTGGEIDGRVRAPLSKSVTHRAIIASFLAGVSFAGGNCEDTDRTFAAMQSLLGEAPVKIDAGESGSTLRFLLPIAAALGIKARFFGRGRLADRPIDGLIDALNAHGAGIMREGDRGLPLFVGGKLTSGTYEIDGGVSSQYITGLLFALPLLDGDSAVKIKGDRVSEGYIGLTLEVLGAFGISVEPLSDGYFVRGGQKYVPPKKLSIEGDWSSAAFLIALGALAGRTEVFGVSKRSLQSDRAVYDILKSAGADISFDGVVTTCKSKLRGMEFSAKDCPDLVPIMAAVAAFSDGVCVIKDVDRLRDKESDRLSAVLDLLKCMGVWASYDAGTLCVFGGSPSAGVFDGAGDHRIAMSATVAAIAMDGVSLVKGVDCVAKSYPDFLKDILSVGAKINEI